MGDFNAHYPSWYFFTLDERAANRGAEIIIAVDNYTLMVINHDSPARKPSRGPSSSPNLPITNSHLGINASWKPKPHSTQTAYPSLSIWTDGFLDLPNLGLSVILISGKQTDNSSQTKRNRLSIPSQRQYHAKLVEKPSERCYFELQSGTSHLENFLISALD